MSVANAGRTTINAYGAGRSVKLIVAGKTGCRLSLSVNEARRMPALPFPTRLRVPAGIRFSLRPLISESAKVTAKPRAHRAAGRSCMFVWAPLVAVIARSRSGDPVRRSRRCPRRGRSAKPRKIHRKP